MFLESEEWKTIRSEALFRSNSRCEICGKKSIHNDAHHIIYPDDIWETDVKHLRILCRICHDLVHTLSAIHSESSLSEQTKFRMIADSIKAWVHSKGDFSRVTELLTRRKLHRKQRTEKEQRCRLCRQVNADTKPQNILSHYGIEQLVVRWPFCEGCFIIFNAGVRWPNLPTNFKPTYKSIPRKLLIRMSRFLYEYDRQKRIPQSAVDKPIEAELSSIIPLGDSQRQVQLPARMQIE